MLSVLSPAKRLDFETPPVVDRHSQPAFLDAAQTLADEAAKLKPEEIQGLMGVSDRIAELNARRFQAFSPPFDLANAKQAVFAFQGDVYQGLDAASLSADDLGFAQDHVRILSGLYGLLRPLDLMQPYRLEMGTKFRNPRGADLYAFWRDTLAPALAAEDACDVLVNLASKEYFSAVDTEALAARGVEVVTPAFHEMRDGRPKIISFHAKKARGAMVRFLVENRIDRVDGLKDFDRDGYTYRDDLSDAATLVFTRPDSRG
ncbi:peroxide stress protein YaaA [Rhodothalassium salexigens]|uniref:peroxide stress protein YaaA n=1 Tax=Rhodothalassium salexigens TaxID=1086 RepID=UPI001913545E|nr:peroxide stress protein YaaA [Rhodothalassium salexigens]MBK5911224.1 peroxide stress protein YaaA [Rhodothalassium salexigens]